AERRDHGRVAADQIGGQPRQTLEIPLRPAVFDGDVATLDETRCTETLTECGHNEVRVARRQTAEEADHGHRRLLRARRERQRRRAAEQRDEMASFHSITSSVRSRNDSGIVRPRALAVVRLMTRSNFVGCSTGISAGLAPRRILSTWCAARREKSE